jgi:ABC-type phosphate transport system substrate-binding protein
MAFSSRKSVLPSLALAALVGGTAGLPNAASALEPEFGAGATLPANLYRSWFNCYGQVIPNTTRPAACPSTVNPNFEYLYAGVGSGAGLAAFLAKKSPTMAPTAPINRNGALTVSDQPKGFTYPYRSYEFSGSDAILTPPQQAAYNNTLARRFGPNIQIPSVATSVTIPYNADGLNLQRTANGKKVLYLSRRSYCGIFTGAIANWNHPALTADNGGQLSANLPIQVYVRADSSGTTELFTRHLDAVCTGAGASGFNWNGGVGTTVNWSARFRKVAGSGGVANGVKSTPGAIGYVSPDYTRIAQTPAIPAPPPVANLQNQADINTGRPNFTHSPSLANVTAAVAAAAPPPAGSDATRWGQIQTSPAIVNSSAANAYPIVGFTFLDFYTCYPAANAAGIVGFVNWYTTSPQARRVAAANAFVPLPTKFRNAIRNLVNGTGGSPAKLKIQAGPVAGLCTL